MKYSISVCIPTCDRPELLAEAIRSCTSQTRPPDEILIGDDSKQDATQNLMAALQAETSIRLVYTRNVPRLGQGANINSLFQRASSTHLVLLHDDDLLLPNALGDLIACWDLHSDLTAAYGKQYVISHEGICDLGGSEHLNNLFRRSSKDAGLQKKPWEVGLFQQFPNDGFMITTSAAKAILWRPAKEVGNGAEFDFGLRLGLAYSKFYFLDTYTAKYRKTSGQSISGSSKDDAALQSYRIIQNVPLPPDAEDARAELLSRFAPRALMQAIRLGKKREAWSIYLSKNHGWSKRFSLGGVRRLGLLLKP